jgi:hypothetical protein
MDASRELTRLTFPPLIEQIPAQKLYKLILEQVSVVSEEMMKELPPAERVFGATFLIAGGTVGAGIIALPVKTAAAGFIPSMAAMACANPRSSHPIHHLQPHHTPSSDTCEMDMGEYVCGLSCL